MKFIKTGWPFWAILGASFITGYQGNIGLVRTMLLAFAVLGPMVFKLSLDLTDEQTIIGLWKKLVYRWDRTEITQNPLSKHYMIPQEEFEEIQRTIDLARKILPK